VTEATIWRKVGAGSRRKRDETMVHAEGMLRPLGRRHAPFIAVALIALLLAACGTAVPTATEIPTRGVLEGRVLGADGRPLGGMVGVVALFCGDEMQTDCLHSVSLPFDTAAFMSSICDLGHYEDRCLLHWISSAARVGGDGSYRIPLVRPGEYGLILVYAVRGGQSGAVLRYNAGVVRAGKTTEYDLVVE